MKYNLGSGRYPLDGWTNVDIHEPADIQSDFRDLQCVNLERVRLSHLLEHVSWRETNDVLHLIHGWLQDRGVVEIEVPDMEAILKLGTEHPLWFKYVYGDQSHEGEYHLAGFTQPMLYGALVGAGFKALRWKKFISTHRGREGMPCIWMDAIK